MDAFAISRTGRSWHRSPQLYALLQTSPCSGSKEKSWMASPTRSTPGLISTGHSFIKCCFSVGCWVQLCSWAVRGHRCNTQVAASPCSASLPVYTSSHPAVDTGPAWAMSCDPKAVPITAVTGEQLERRLPCVSCGHYRHVPQCPDRPWDSVVTGPFYPKSLLSPTRAS